MKFRISFFYMINFFLLDQTVLKRVRDYIACNVYTGKTFMGEKRLRTLLKHTSYLLRFLIFKPFHFRRDAFKFRLESYYPEQILIRR